MRSSQSPRRPVELLDRQMAVAKLARLSEDWPAYERARDNALHLVLSHRVEDEVGRFRQVMTACTGLQDRGQDAREFIQKKLMEAFSRAIERRENAHDVIVRMNRIPRAGATVVLVSEMRRGEGEGCVRFLLANDGRLAGDVPAVLGSTPAHVAARLSDRDWEDLMTPLLAIGPGELRKDVTAAARTLLLRTLCKIAARLESAQADPSN